MNFLTPIKTILEQAHVMPDDGTVLVALSGGADSVGLLLAMKALGYQAEALHCNFELRGTASDGDEAFCRRLCRTQDIALQVKHFRTRSYAQRHHISMEMAARQLRYDWFAEVAAEKGAQAVCVAHHRDDNIETLLLNLIRGTGIHGLTGMKESTTYQAAGTGLKGPLQIVRPMLTTPRTDIEAWLTEQGQTWVTDQTNLDPDAALRNKIRLQLLPLMETMNPRVRETLAATAQRLTETESLFNNAVRDIQEGIGDGKGNLNVEALKRATAAGTVLHETLHPLGFTAEQVSEIHADMEGEPGKLWESRDGWRLLRDRGRLLMQDAISTEAIRTAGTKVLPLDGLYEAPYGTRLLIRRQAIDPANFDIPRDKNAVCFDLEKLTLPLTIRTAAEADRFQPFGMKGTKLLSDFLTDLKLSLFDKERQLVVMSGDRIAWVVGRRVAAGYEVDSTTRHLLTITLL